MSSFRNTKHLDNKRIVYRRDPITDKPTVEATYWDYYENGTYECYQLFRSRAKITTFKSLKWHLLVLWYLNPDWDMEKFESIASFISIKANGFATFNISDKFLTNMIYDISMLELDTPPKNKRRKVIFKDNTGLETSEKLSIVGSLIGRSKKVTSDDIYQCMLEINDENKKITISGLGKLLQCSSRTIYRNLPHELKKEKELLNQQVT